MGEMWRVVDTGLRSAAQNIALDRALLEARGAEESSSTLRFARFAPCALLACRHSAAQEFDLDYCKGANLAVQRRITGGNAMYCDEAQLGWALYLHQREVRTSDMQAIAKRVCHAVAAAVGALGVDARFRARQDIEVDGRTLGSAGGAFDDKALLYQGILLIDVEISRMARALRNPALAHCDQAVAAVRERTTDLKNVMGRRPDPGLIQRNIIEAFESEFGVEFHDGDLSLTEHTRYQRALAEIETPGWIHLVQQPASVVPVCAAAYQRAGRALNANLIYDRGAHRIKQVWFTYDRAIRPQRAIADLEAALRDTSVERLEHNVRTFFTAHAVDMPVLVPADFVAVVRRALKLPLVVQNP